MYLPRPPGPGAELPRVRRATASRHWQSPAGRGRRGGTRPSSVSALCLVPAAASDWDREIFQAERVCPGTDGGAWKGKEGQPA